MDDAKTPHRSETDGIEERAVRRVTEGTATAVVQSGPMNGGTAMGCHGCLRNAHDMMAAGKRA